MIIDHGLDTVLNFTVITGKSFAHGNEFLTASERQKLAKTLTSEKQSKILLKPDKKD
jgi:hypothetical protein